MKRQFVTYPIALSLKELGFDEPCIAYWRNGLNDIKPILLSEFILDNSRTVYYTQCNGIEISAPLYQQCIDWFREECDIHINLAPYTNPAKGVDKILYEYSISTKENSYEGGLENTAARLIEGLKTKKSSFINLFGSYEEAREQAILKCIELCKNKK